MEHRRTFPQIENLRANFLHLRSLQILMMITRCLWQVKLWVIRFTVLIVRAGDEVLIGGQAVFEGVMMRSPRSYSVAVRKADQTIVTKKDYLNKVGDRKKILKLP